MPIGVMTGGSIGLGLYQTKKSGDINEQSIDAQQRIDAQAIAAEERQAELDRALEREKLDWQAEQARFERERLERARRQALQFDRQRWRGYLRANQPFWRVGQGALASLADLAGVGLPAGGGGMNMAALQAMGPQPTARDPNIRFGGDMQTMIQPNMRVPPVAGATLSDVATGQPPAVGRGRRVASQALRQPTPQSSGMSLPQLLSLYALANDPWTGLGPGQTPATVGL